MVPISEHEVFVLFNYISVLIMLGCCAAIGSHAESRMQKLALMVCISLTMCCIGFLIRVEANTAEVLLVGQKLIYAFVTHGMFLMLLFILDYCRFQIPKAVQWVFHGINLLITVIVLTMEHHTLFYRSYWAVEQGGYAILEKEYGPAHTLAVGIFGLYMAAAVIVTVLFSVKNIKSRTKYVWRLLVAVMLPCISYVIPKLTDSNNDFQPMAFAAFTVLVLAMIYRYNLYDVDNLAVRYSVSSMEEGLVIFNQSYLFQGCNKQAEKLFPVLNELTIDSDIRSISPLLTELLQGTKKELHIGEEIYSVAVRPIEQNGRLQGRVLWIQNVTIERNYTDLLKAQKQLLESEVLTLYDISYKDHLTGLWNRRCFEEDLDGIRKGDNTAPLVLVSADLNELKEINDQIGHFAGDELIRGASAILNQAFTPFGKVYRTGGDEFFAILTETGFSTAAADEQLKQAMQEWKGKYVSGVSISYGYAVAQEHPDKNIDELLIVADRAMYANKRQFYMNNGKDRRRS